MPLMWQKYNKLYVIIYKDRYELINEDKKILSEGKVVFKDPINGCIEYCFEPVVLENVSGGKICL